MKQQHTENIKKWLEEETNPLKASPSPFMFQKIILALNETKTPKLRPILIWGIAASFALMLFSNLYFWSIVSDQSFTNDLQALVEVYELESQELFTLTESTWTESNY